MNTKDIIAIIREEISARRLLQNVKEISCYHRVQASQGYRDAAYHCQSYLSSLGIDAKVLSYPANKTDYIGPYKLFQEWNIQQAYCDITYPIQKRIADFSIEPISIIQKSYPCDLHDIEVILMDRGTDAAAYTDIDFTGKIIFIHESFKEFMWAIQKKGAIGFISDFYNEVPYVRNREEMQDSLNYTSFWWKHGEDEKEAFGFVLSPRDGKSLTKLCEQVRQDYQDGKTAAPYIKVNAFIDAKLFDGNFDVVEATLPGTSKEMILMTAHLCHPCSSANDNASGVSGGIEVLRALHELIKKEKLPPLQKTIKLILVPEFTGTYGYLNDVGDVSKFIAGINLDMIGGRQQDVYGPITVSKLPHALPSFVDVLACMIMKQIKEDIKSVENMQMSLVNTYDHLFQLGSDHSILNDPMIDIPCIMLGQWPDKNYHTSTDTLDKIDPVVLKYSTTVAASYVYALANQIFSMNQVIQELRVQYLSELNHIADTYEENRKTIAYDKLCAFYQDSLTSLYTFMNVEIEKTEIENLKVIREMYHADVIKHEYTDAYLTKPERLFTFQVSDLEDVMVNNKAMQEKYHAYQKQHPVMGEEHGTLQLLCDYYVDGKRTIAEIYECVSAETGLGKPEDILAYISLMKQLQLMK